MKKIVVIGAVLLLLAGGGGAAWFLLGGHSGEGAKEPPPAAFTPGAAPVYVPLGKMQVPVFDGGALAGQLVFEATLLVPDARAKEAVAARVIVMRDVLLRDLSDVALLVALTGKPVATDQLKARLTKISGRILGHDQPFELLIQNYSYVPI